MRKDKITIIMEERANKRKRELFSEDKNISCSIT